MADFLCLFGHGFTDFVHFYFFFMEYIVQQGTVVSQLAPQPTPAGGVLSPERVTHHMWCGYILEVEAVGARDDGMGEG